MRRFDEFVPVFPQSPVPDRQARAAQAPLLDQTTQGDQTQEGQALHTDLCRAVPEALNGIPCARALEALGRGGRVIGSLKALARKGRGKSPGSLFRRADGQCSDATLPIRDSLCQLFSWRLAACARQEQFGRLEMLRPGDTS